MHRQCSLLKHRGFYDFPITEIMTNGNLCDPVQAIIVTLFFCSFFIAEASFSDLVASVLFERLLKHYLVSHHSCTLYPK